MKPKQISVLGSTGSIGTQALEIVRAYPERYQVNVLTAGSNSSKLISQALEFKPDYVAIADETKYLEITQALSNTPTKVLAGKKAIEELAAYSNSEIVLTAMVGFAGLAPTIKAIRSGKNIALANKETLVVAGEIITAEAAENKVKIYPVDSEHSAIFQCLQGENNDNIEKIILTASGGPFRNKSLEYIANASKKQALKHPNWEMGAKITIDSASMMNKGLEAIEAKWLFNLEADQIEVIIHPQSIIHSMVQFTDGSLKAQMGLPDMKLPIAYALNYPDRLPFKANRFNFADYPQLTFEAPDFEKFKNLKTAFEAMRKGGNMPCIINAANEAAVEAFLKDKIKFLEIAEVIEETANHLTFKALNSLDELINTHEQAYKQALQIILKKA